MAEISTTNGITFFAETNFRGQRKRFGIKREDRRKHVYIIGKTGMGKSTLLENMTIQDIWAGRGVAVVDPHGEYAEKMLDFIPKERIDDVVYFNPADTEYPVAFNIMEKVSEDQRHLVSSGLLGVFKRIWPDVWSPRMEYLLANAILALLEIPGSTLLGVNRIFGEKEFRKRIVNQLQDPVIKGFWENEFAKYPEQFMREAVAAIQNKVGQFSSNPLIRNIIGQVESAVDMRKIMDEGKIFIINLSKGKIGEENSRLLGAMLVTKLYLAAMSRVDVPEPERRDFYLYVDEFQNFATDSFASILSEARKYRLNLTIAHQYVGQLMTETSTRVRDAVFGNVGTMVVFRVGAEDAELLEKEFMPEFVIQDLVNLGFKNVYLKLMIDGLTSRPFSAETLAPFPRPAESWREEIVKKSRQRHGTPRASVEEKIRRFTQPIGFEAVSHAERGGGLSSPGGPERKMYETRCATCGKTTLVPFEPDGKRPVYCEEHMDLIKFRSKLFGGESGPSAPHRTSPGSEKTKAHPTMSLQELKPRHNAAGLSQLPFNQSQPKKGQSANLQELRKALAEAMSERQEKNLEAKLPSLSPQERMSPSGGTLKPGETLRLE